MHRRWRGTPRWLLPPINSRHLALGQALLGTTMRVPSFIVPGGGSPSKSVSQLVTILAMQSRITSARNRRSI